MVSMRETGRCLFRVPKDGSMAIPMDPSIYQKMPSPIARFQLELMELELELLRQRQRQRGSERERERERERENGHAARHAYVAALERERYGGVHAYVAFLTPTWQFLGYPIRGSVCMYMVWLSPRGRT